MPRKLLGIVVGGATLLAVLVVGASPADAHAELLETTPANGEVLDTAPTQVHLRFSETIDIPDKALEVFGESGDELERAAAGTIKRVYRPKGTPDFAAAPGTARLRAFLEIKTVWHPVGALSLAGGSAY